MSLSGPVMDDRGEIDLRSIDALSRDDLRGWIRDRLRGVDLSCAGDARSGDMREYLLQILYPKLDRATREDMQGIVLDFLDDLFRNPDSEWLGEPGSRLLLMLDPVLAQSPRRDQAVGLLLGMADTPRFTEGPFPNLHLRALQALLGLKHRADRRFWERQFQVGGERYAPVVLEGLASIDASSLLDWLADVPWSEAIGDAFEGLLPSLLEDYGPGKITALIERVFPRLTPESATALERMCTEEGLTRSAIGGDVNRPRFLYRYRPINPFSLQEIEHNTVYLCPLPKLNDPREGGFRYEPSNVTDLRQQLVGMALRDGEVEIAALLDSATDEAIRDIERQMLQAGTSHLDARGGWGVACFTERYDNLAMWAHYADQGRGGD